MLIWAVQQDDDVETRQQLPDWIAKPVERFILNWADESKKWKMVKLEREKKGKDLTAHQKRQFDEFQQNRSMCKLLFNKDTETVVWKIRTNTDLKKIRLNHFSLKVLVVNEGEGFQIKAANGEAKHLVLLQGEAVEGKSVVPTYLDAGVDADVAAAAEAGNLDEDEHGDEEQEQAEEEGGALMEAAVLEAEEQCLEEVCYDTSDEEQIEKLFPHGHVKVKAFMRRDEYQELKSKGLTMIPDHEPGIFLSFHKTTRTWQGFYPNVSTGLSYTFGGSTKRVPAAHFHVPAFGKSF